jgi:hypothetical protein
MIETTQKFQQLPPLAGVPFTGFEFAEIKSRKSVVKQLRNFVNYCLRETTSPAFAVILGEWGEGKTEAYQRYIKTKVKTLHHPYMVSASSVADSLPKVQAESPLASLNFLAAVFYAIRYEAQTNLIPPLERFVDTDQWLEAILKEHAGGKILIFIDEFEELILNPPALKRILSGLKELVNRQYPPVSESGKYAGIISFIVSCTPNAYARMQRDQGIEEIFGSWERRHSMIQLAAVTKREGVEFLYALLRYAFPDHLPEPLPIKDLGVFYTLQTIGRGNLGVLVKLFCTVFNSATVDDQTMYVIDGTRMLDILASETVSVYGASAKCVESHLLKNLEDTLDEQEVKLLRLLAGELRPFSTSEIARRLEFPDDTEVLALAERVNQKLVRVNITNAITHFIPLHEGLSFENIRQALQQEIRENEIHIDGFTQRMDELEDSLTFLELHEGQLIPRMFFPSGHDMISATFDGITPNSARRLEKRVSSVFDSRKLYYRLSNELIFQLFPTPIPIGLEFIKDRGLQLNMWRDTNTRFRQLFRDDILKAFFGLIQYVEAFDIEASDLRTLGNGLAVTLHDTSQNAAMGCYCYAHYGDLSAETVRQIDEGLREVGDAHLAIIIYVGEVTEQGREEMRVREIENQILLIPLHTSLAKRLLITSQCKIIYPKHIDDRLFIDSVIHLFKAELELSRKVKEWLEQGTRAGMVLRDLYKATAKGERELADSFKFYINRLGVSDTPENVFQANQRLMSFVPFGSRAGFIPDIESASQLEKYTGDLAKNGFVRWDSDRTVHVLNTPPEKRLLHILQASETIAKSEIGDRFINCAQAKRILEDVYLNILRHKGIIIEAKGLLSLMKREEALQQAKEIREKYKETLRVKKQQEEWSAFAHIFVTKQRALRFISISELEAYLDELYDDIQKAAQQGQMEVVFQRTALLDNLAEHLQNTLMPKVDGAISGARTIREKVSNQIDSSLEDLTDVLNQYNKWLKQNATLGDIKEFKELERGKVRLQEIYITSISENDLSEEEKKDNIFDHKGWSDPDQYSNVVLRRLQQFANALQQQIDRFKRTLEEMRKALKSLAEVGQGIRSRLLTIYIREGYKLSKIVYIQLETLLKSISATDSTFIPQSEDGTTPALTLNKMLADLQELHRPLDGRYKEVERAITPLQDLVEAETKFYQVAQQCSEAYQILSVKADVELFLFKVQGLEPEWKQIHEDYDCLAIKMGEMAIDETTKHTTITNVRQEVEQFTKRLNNVIEGLEQVWKDYVRECERFVGLIYQMMELVRRQDDSLKTHIIETECEGLLGAVKGREWPEEAISNYETMKSDIHQKMMGLLKKTLDEAEGNVLFEVVERREQSKSGWFNLSQIVHEIAEDMALSNTEVEKTLNSLVQKGYLIQGIATPI